MHHGIETPTTEFSIPICPNCFYTPQPQPNKSSCIFENPITSQVAYLKSLKVVIITSHLQQRLVGLRSSFTYLSDLAAPERTPTRHLSPAISRLRSLRTANPARKLSSPAAGSGVRTPSESVINWSPGPCIPRKN